MKRVFPLILLAFLLFQGCSEDESSFACDKNAQFVYNDEMSCAHARVESYSLESSGYESVTLFVTGNFTNFTITVFNSNGLTTGEEYSYLDNAYMTGPGHNQTFSLTINFSKIDRESGIISGSFEFETERDVNSNAVPFNSNGSFKDISLSL